MPDLKDLYNDLAVATLMEPNQITADAYSDYVDTQGYNGVLFLVQGDGTTADATHYVTPKLYGYTGAAPQTASGYSLCAAAEFQGSFGAINDTNDHIAAVGLVQHLYRYYMILFDETSTADVEVSACALLSSRNQPAGDDTPTTGAVS